jgi:predicted Fe-Mo cluster-binding NifX family protein
MKICFPTETLQGLESQVFEHFGSAAGFVIVDTESKSVEEINNSDRHHAHGMCQPLKALGGLQVDAVAVGGIGMGALMKLQALGIRVFRVTPGTVGQNIQFIMKNNLPEFDASFACAGHTSGGCAH